MEQWISWPWIEMLIACVFLMGVGLALFLLTNKFPAARFLGQLTLAYLLTIPVYSFDLTQPWFSIAVVFIALSLSWYSSSFFTQNSRVNIRQLGWMVFLFIASAMSYFNQMPWIAKGTAALIGAGFLLGSIRTFQKEGRSRGISWFQNPGVRLAWFRNYFVFNVLSVLALFLLGQLGDLWMICAIVGLNFLYLFYQIFEESGFFSPLSTANKYKKSTLTASQKAAILERLDQLVLEDKFYLSDDASLSSLAEKLHTTTHHLSQVLNESKGMSFQELISANRVREARRLLKDPDQSQTKVENIAAMVGYNSKSAFNTAFKRHTGMTPSEYREARDVRSYREELLPDKKKPSNPVYSFSLSQLFIKKLKHTMVTNFFKTFIRTLKRNKVFSLINLFGLTVGFTCSILIYWFIQDELSYDRSLPNYENIYRIGWHAEHSQTRTPHPMAQAMRRDFPDVKTAVSLSPWYGTGLTKQEISVRNRKANILFEEPDFYFADSTFFDVFQLEVLEGDASALHKPNTLVITDQLARKYFGEESAIGQALEIEGMPIEVSAVVKGMPRNAHFHFNALISYVTIKQIDPESHWMTWADFGHFNYLVLHEGSSAQTLEAKIPDWIFNYLDWGEDARTGFENGTLKFELQQIADIHLHSHLRWELESNGNILYVYILLGTLVFILIIAAINYANLTTAKSIERAKEIGVRKTLGAVSGNLTFQFYLESMLFCLMAMILAFGLTALVLDPFNELSSKSFELSVMMQPGFATKALLLCLAIGLISGIYPAIFLSSFAPSDVLKGKLNAGSGNSHLRSLLVVCQFVVSAILITSTLIVLKQIDYMKSKELGFDQNAVISVPIPSSVEHGGINLSETRAIQQELKAIPGVKEVSAASNLPGAQFNNHPFSHPEYLPNRMDASEIFVDFGLVELLDLEMVEGRSFDPGYAADSAGTHVLINEATAKVLNIESPIGEKINWHLSGRDLEVTVIGVVKNFHYKSLHSPINPLIIQFSPWDFNHTIIKLEGGKFQESLLAIEELYARFGQEENFQYHFLDQQLADLYENEVRTLSIFSSFAAIALFLACLGLLGIALAMLSQRVKEVGIRKILGASPTQIVRMIFLQFTKLIAIALILGLPIAYMVMSEWLGEFPYQASLGPMPFVWSAVLLLLVAISSVSLVVTKIAATNPVKALRHE